MKYKMLHLSCFCGIMKKTLSIFEKRLKDGVGVLPIIFCIDDTDRSFVEDIYLNYEKKLYAKAMRYINNYHDAQDRMRDASAAYIEKI